MSNIDNYKIKNKVNMEAQWSNIFDNTFLNAMVNAAIERNIKIKELTERVREAEKTLS